MLLLSCFSNYCNFIYTFICVDIASLFFKSPQLVRVRARTHTEACWLKPMLLTALLSSFCPQPKHWSAMNSKKNAMLLLSGWHWRTARWPESWRCQRRNQANKVAKAFWKMCKGMEGGRPRRWDRFVVGTEEVGWTRWRQACILHQEVWICFTDAFWSFWNFGF